MKHPDLATLALYSGGDAPWWRCWWVERHVSACDLCGLELDRFQNARAGAELLGKAPLDLPWDYLAAEMRANIRLGLEAGALVARPRMNSQALGWRAAVALACLSILIVSGWLLYFPQTHQPARGGGWMEAPAVVASIEEGLEVKQGNAGFVLRYTDPQAVTVSVNAQGAVEARSVDSETGYVTISNVYVE